jgi:membrane associated rhomboid family serine protease
MGIYERDYYRESNKSFLGSFTDRGLMCKWLIGINVAVFLLQILTRTPSPLNPLVDVGPVTDWLVLSSDKVLHGQVWRLLTAAFLHSTLSPMHILFNMLFLWWFGSDVEDLYGPREFLAFYLVAAVLGNITFVLTHLAGGAALGASGAVTAVLVLCAMHYPTRIILLFFVLPVPIWLFVVFMIVRDLAALAPYLGGTGENVAVDVHLAGALFGYLYYKFQWRFTTWLPQFKNWRRRMKQPRLRVYRDEEPAPVARSQPVLAATEEEALLEAKVDAVLEKISRVGKENLTDSEREVLLKASEVFRKRRQ